MKSTYLFPNLYKKVGWLLLAPGLIFGILFLIFQSDLSLFNTTVFAFANETIFKDTSYFSFLENNILDELSCILMIIGMIFLAFSREKLEDEFISKIRLESLVWATYVNYGILILAILLVYNMSFFWVLIFNMFTLLTFFLLRFNWALFTTKNQLGHEE